MKRFALYFLLTAGAPSIALAAPTFVVNIPDDVADDVLDGVCETAKDNGRCTLRAAVMEASAVVGGGATIRLPARTYFLTKAPVGSDDARNGDLDVDASMTIVGDGPSATIVDANRIDRVFAIRGNVVTLRGLTVRNGLGSEAKPGGGIFHERGRLHVENAVVSDNEGTVGAGILSFLNAEELTLEHCIVEDNRAARDGGGIAALGSTLQILDSWIYSNDSGSTGGGIVGGRTMRIERSLIQRNHAAEGGGGIAAYTLDGLLVRNSTLFENNGGTGAGAVLVKYGDTQLINVTVTDNRQSLYGTGQMGALAEESGTLLLKGSVVAGNLAANQAQMGYDPAECGTPAAPILSGDYNVIGNRSSCFLMGALAHVNASDVDPGLGPLEPNGGFAMAQEGVGATHKAIPAASCTDELGAPLLDDQRGLARIGDCDLGAAQEGALFAPPALLGVELIRNGGAEGNELGRATDGNGVEAPPLWRGLSGSLTQISYGAPGGYPLAGEAPPGSGSMFFGGGFTAAAAQTQAIDVSSLAAQIDAGEIGFRASGAFGGYFIDDDAATLSVIFRSGAGVIDSVALGGFTSDDRGGSTGLLKDQTEGTLPPGTRSVLVRVDALRTNGESNDGYADDLSLVLVPEASPALLGVVALAALLSLRARRGRAMSG